MTGKQSGASLDTESPRCQPAATTFTVGALVANVLR